MVDTIISNSVTTLIDGAVDRTHLRSDVYVGVSRLEVGGNCFTLQACVGLASFVFELSNIEFRPNTTINLHSERDSADRVTGAVRPARKVDNSNSIVCELSTHWSESEHNGKIDGDPPQSIEPSSNTHDTLTGRGVPGQRARHLNSDSHSK